MALITNAIKGTQDILPRDSHKLKYVEDTLLNTARLFGFSEMRTPVFEHTELFARGVGDTTDVVQKEMYTFDDKGGRSVTLRPEGTAGAMRAFLEHGLFNEPMPQKVCYLTSCYRYEKPQAGRYREFHQFGVEIFGTSSPAADAELISLGAAVFEELGVEKLSLEINSIGCPECKRTYHGALREYFEARRDELCPTCLERLERNPMRILDCKSPVCSGLAAAAPAMLDFICEPCREHFGAVRERLDALGLSYTVNPRIVRGLDYYTRTVFEFVSDEIGAQSTVCGGGRYDGLAKEMGGQDTPSLGFALGIERLMMLMAAQNCDFPEPEPCDIYIASAGEAAAETAARILFDLRLSGISARGDIVGRSIKAQMKYADKLGAKYVCVIGDNELKSGTATLKNMRSGEASEMELDDFADTFMDICVSETVDEFKSFMGGMDMCGLDTDVIDISKLLGKDDYE